MTAFARHCFSSRQLGLAGMREEDHQGWTALAHAVGLEREFIVQMRQVHGANVFQPDRRQSGGHDRRPEADIAVCSDPSLGVSVRAADCVPLLLVDRATGAVAAIHAGWKGTAAGAAIVAVQELHRRFGSRPADLLAAAGPSIGPCCYVVGEELVERFEHHAGSSRWFLRQNGLRLNLWRATRDQLEGAGVPPHQIQLCDLCTSDHPHLFHSYRRDGQSAGRLVAVIRSGPGPTL
jgi:YfiH family protein